MITKETYEEMKGLCEAYEKNTFPPIGPYIVVYTVEVDKKYNPEFGDAKKCKCGHPYYRHFDSYDRMEAVGCKYCACYDFELAEDEN